MLHLVDNIKYARGFTLIELLVVIAIIGLLSSIVLVNVHTAQMKARDDRRMMDLEQIRNALELYYNDNGYYPGAGATLSWDCECYSYSSDIRDDTWDIFASIMKPYIQTLPKDPLNTGCVPWGGYGCYSYAYSFVGKSISPNNPYGVIQYNLTAQLEDPNSPYRCTIKDYRFFFDNISWCPSGDATYRGRIYEASLQ